MSLNRKTHTMKVGNLLPTLKAQLIDGDGEPADLTGASVRFHMRDSDNEVAIDAAADILDATDGQVEYVWAAGDTDIPGTYDGEFEVTIGGKVTSYPNENQFRIQIKNSIA